MSQSENVTCRACWAVNGKDNRFCVSCGIELSDKCPECDAHILKSDKFCISCGLKLFEEIPLPPKPRVQLPKRKVKLRAKIEDDELVEVAFRRAEKAIRRRLAFVLFSAGGSSWGVSISLLGSVTSTRILF